MRFGIHAGPQDCTIDDLRRLWRIADERGFHWCSVWDHLYSVSDLSNPAKPVVRGRRHDGGARAAATRNVRVGCLVFCVGYRNPGVLLQGGGHHRPPERRPRASSGSARAGTRTSSAPSACRSCRSRTASTSSRRPRSCCAGSSTASASRSTASRCTWTTPLCEPRPVQERLRLWIGGQGEKRLLRIVARHADGWNVPFLAPEVYATRNATLNDWCEKERRDPRAIVRTINVGLAIGADEARARQQEEKLQLMFGALTDFVKPGHLIGTPAQVRDRIGEYERAGAEWVILALRAPVRLGRPRALHPRRDARVPLTRGRSCWCNPRGSHPPRSRGRPAHLTLRGRRCAAQRRGWHALSGGMSRARRRAVCVPDPEMQRAPRPRSGMPRRSALPRARRRERGRWCETVE